MFFVTRGLVKLWVTKNICFFGLSRFSAISFSAAFKVVLHASITIPMATARVWAFTRLIGF
ncbi:MAG: hypothetical protein FWC97_00835 [Treponema sp.]|nr:hypothetical protein [Treponema sp.]